MLQRQVADYDKIDKDEKITSSAQIFRDGHSGILTTDMDARVDNVTTVRQSYKTPQPCGVRLVGNAVKTRQQFYINWWNKTLRIDSNIFFQMHYFILFCTNAWFPAFWNNQNPLDHILIHSRCLRKMHISYKICMKVLKFFCIAGKKEELHKLMLLEKVGYVIIVHRKMCMLYVMYQYSKKNGQLNCL